MRTRDRLKKIGLCDDGSYPICGDQLEDHGVAREVVVFYTVFLSGNKTPYLLIKKKKTYQCVSICSIYTGTS